MSLKKFIYGSAPYNNQRITVEGDGQFGQKLQHKMRGFNQKMDQLREKLSNVPTHIPDVHHDINTTRMQLNPFQTFDERHDYRAETQSEFNDNREEYQRNQQVPRQFNADRVEVRRVSGMTETHYRGPGYDVQILRAPGASEGAVRNPMARNEPRMDKHRRRDLQKERVRRRRHEKEMIA